MLLAAAHRLGVRHPYANARTQIVGSCVSVTNALLFLPAVPRTKQVRCWAAVQGGVWLALGCLRLQAPGFCAP